MAEQELIKSSAAVMPREYDTEIQKRYLPVMSLAVAKERRHMLIEAVSDLMVEATEKNNFEGDYGVIPGTKQKTLFQPGADKLNNLFGLVPRFEVEKEYLDWTGSDHDGEPFFFYQVKCTLWRDTYLMGEGVGSCNSWESKYRYRKAERICPDCGAAAIIKGKPEFGGGWICWKKAKTPGCGAQFSENDPLITSQVTGNVANEHIFDLVNTILKIAGKRAKIAGTINATSAHEFFTQDVDDAKILPSQQNGGETLEEMRARKILEAQERMQSANSGRMTSAATIINGIVTPSEPEPSPEIKEMLDGMKDANSIRDAFAELMDKCQAKLRSEEEGRKFYKTVLKEFGAEKVEDLRSYEKCKRCARALAERIAQVQSAPDPVITSQQVAECLNPVL